MSATAATAGRRQFHRKVPMPTSCTSTPAGSFRRTAITVGTVFRCVASRNRERGPLGPGTKPPGPPSGPNPLGENITFSSPPLEPRGLLLSVMRQKVGKERSQGDCHPLGHPPLLPELGRNNSSKTPGGRVALPPGIERKIGAENSSKTPGGCGPGLPRQRCPWNECCGQVVGRRHQWLRLVGGGCGYFECSLLVLPLRWDPPTVQQLPWERFSVALPPGIEGCRSAREPHPRMKSFSSGGADFSAWDCATHSLSL